MLPFIIIALLMLLAAPTLAEDTDEPLFPARHTDGRWGYINARGIWIIPPRFGYAQAFRGQYAGVYDSPADMTPRARSAYIYNHDCQGIIDRAGEYVLPPEYVLESGVNDCYYGGRHTGIWTVTKCCLPETEERLEGFFDVPSGYFSGLIYARCGGLVGNGALIPVVPAGEHRAAYVRRNTGEMVIPALYDGLLTPFFLDGTATVQLADEYGHGQGPCFLIDETGSRLPMPEGVECTDRSLISEGLIAVRDAAGRFGYADTMGSLVIPPKFLSARGFREGLAAVQVTEQEYGYIDRAGRVILRGFSVALDFRDGLAKVTVGGRDAVVDPEGRLYPEGYIGNGLYLKHGKDPSGREICSLADRTGPVSIIFQAPRASAVFHEGRLPVRTQKGWCYLDETGRIVIPGPFASADSFRDGLAYIETQTQAGYIDRDGRPVFGWARDTKEE